MQPNRLTIDSMVLNLEWHVMYPITCDGDRVTVHFLSDANSGRCYATITEPRAGNVLYATDLRTSHQDRSYDRLEGAKAYAQWAAFDQDRQESEQTRGLIRRTLAAPFDEQDDPLPKNDRPNLWRRLIQNVRRK